jgi:hypothetical protein
LTEKNKGIFSSVKGKEWYISYLVTNVSIMGVGREEASQSSVPLLDKKNRNLKKEGNIRDINAEGS